MTPTYLYLYSNTEALEKYPVVPSFAHWRFPHDNLPESWTSCQPLTIPFDRQLPRQSSSTQATLARDISCRITNHIESTEHSHLVPRSEERWFRENGMFRYANQRPRSEPVDDSRNAILLRSDLHIIFDQKRFAIVPKSSALLIHIIAPGSSLQLMSLYHNVSLQPLIGVAIECVLARFAWTIFAQSVDFVQKGSTRRLCIHVGDGEISITEFSGDQCMQFLSSRAKSRSQNPRKRQRDISTSSPGDGEEDIEKEYVQGRRRRRSFDSSLQESSFGEKLWTTSQETILDTDIDDNDGELDSCDNGAERQSKRRCTPDILYWIQVRRISWPAHLVYIIQIMELRRKPDSMWRSIVFYKNRMPQTIL
ncbi:MAG: hypothetical protein M1813_007072 [Trichoglossum hirsutum]|nr:MAG: hypothetical protein M1813_007072 [Trichoglossum hirsutum]